MRVQLGQALALAGEHSKAVALLSVKVVGAALALLTNIAIARLLEPGLAGVYFIGISSITIAYALARLGFGYSTYRAVAEHDAAGDREGIQNVLKTSVAIVFASSVLVSAVILIIPSGFIDRVFEANGVGRTLKIIAISIPVFCVASMLSEVLKGLNKAILFGLFDSVIIKASALALIFVLAPAYGVAGAATGYVIGTVIGALFCIYAVQKLAGLQISWLSAFRVDKDLVRATGYFSVLSFSTVAIQWISPILVGVQLSPEAAASIFTAARTAAVIEFVTLSVAATAGPRLIRVMKFQGGREMRFQAAKLAGATAIVAALVATPAVIWAEELMGLYGTVGLSGSDAFRVLALSQVINAPLAILALSAVAARQEKRMAITSMMAAVGTFFAVALAADGFGILGAAVALAFGVISANILLVAAGGFSAPTRT